VHTVFFSYKSEERQTAQSLMNALRAELGCSVWWDQDLQTGGQWSQEIDAAVQSAACVVVLWSKLSVQSQWVHQEAAVAKALGTLTPVQIEDCTIPVPYASIQSAHLKNWRGDVRDAEFVKLVSRVKACLDKKTSANYLPARVQPRGIGIVGASGTGKTTLVEDIKQLNSTAPLLTIQGVSRWVIQSGYPLGMDAHPESYVVLMRSHISELLKVKETGDVWVSERTLLDQFCYSRVNSSLPRPSVRDELIDLMQYVWLLEREFYNFYLYLPIEPSTRGHAKDGDEKYQAKIDKEFKTLLHEFDIKYYEIKGGPVARARQANELIHRLRKEIGRE
jgi:hypothetical protein